MSTIKNLEELVRSFCEDRNWDQFHDPKNLAIGITTEAAELLDLFRFKEKAEIEEKIRTSQFNEKVQDEIADILFFVLRFAQMNNINLETALSNKIKKNALKYPIETAKNSNKKYNE